MKDNQRIEVRLAADPFGGLVGDPFTLEPETSAHDQRIDMRNLSLFHRALLVTDGTVTKFLEACLLEPIQAVKLFQGRVKLSTDIPWLAVGEGEEVTIRRVLLVGRYSQNTYAYAESVLVHQRMGPQIMEELEKTGRDLGRVIRETRLETYREIVRCGREPVNDLGNHFSLAANEHVLSRTYRILAQGQPVMLITEKFPPTDPTVEQQRPCEGDIGRRS